MTDTQPDGLTIAELLGELSDTLSKPPAEGRKQQYWSEVQEQLDAITDAISQWIQALDANTTAGMDQLILNAVYETLDAEIRGRLAAAAGDDPVIANQSWTSIAAVCKEEYSAFNMFLRPPGTAKPMPDASEPPLDAWTITLRRCTISGGRIRTEYTRPDRPGIEPSDGLSERSLSMTLALLRANGIQTLKFDNADGFPLETRRWLANAARKVFIDCGSRGKLLVNTTVCVPERGVTMYTHLSFFATGTCRIRFEAVPVLVVFGARPDRITPAALAERVRIEKAALVGRYELAQITELDGAAWTLIELHQLGSALAKMPRDDQVVLRGLTFVRKHAAPTDTEETLEAGSYRFADRTITLLDASFSTDDYGFVGTTDEIGPYSHWTMLHEVGHAVEKYRWEMEYRRWDTAGIKQEISQLEVQRQAASGALIQKLESQIIDLRVRLLDYSSKQAELVNTLKRNQSSSASLQAFVRLVTEKNITACTGYAYTSWATKHGEFFAEAYSLFLNEPLFLNHVSNDLYGWFAAGGYRASW